MKKPTQQLADWNTLTEKMQGIDHKCIGIALGTEGFYPTVEELEACQTGTMMLGAENFNDPEDKAIVELGLKLGFLPYLHIEKAEDEGYRVVRGIDAKLQEDAPAGPRVFVDDFDKDDTIVVSLEEYKEQRGVELESILPEVLEDHGLTVSIFLARGKAREFAQHILNITEPE